MKEPMRPKPIIPSCIRFLLQCLQHQVLQHALAAVIQIVATGCEIQKSLPQNHSALFGSATEPLSGVCI
jgi:hypothetical protein